MNADQRGIKPRINAGQRREPRMLAEACRSDRWSETEAALICRGRPELPGMLRAKIGDSSLVVTVAPGTWEPGCSRVGRRGWRASIRGELSGVGLASLSSILDSSVVF